MKKLLSLVLSLVMLLSVTAGMSFTAKAVDNPYPYYNYYNSSTDYQVACTWYAWEQAKERGIIISEDSWHDAGNWYSVAPYQKGAEPRALSIACWNFTSASPHGHVAFVTGVNSDGSIEIVEGGSNWAGNVHGVHSRTVTRGQYWPDLGFIYLKCATHTWDKGVITKKPTCKKDGVKKYTCTVCGETKTSVIKMGEKYHDYESLGTVKATLTTNGVLGKECKICKKQVKSTIYHPSKYYVSTSNYTYDGHAKKPSVTVKDTKGNVIDSKYYSLSYSDNKNVGTAIAKVKFKGRYSGTKKVKFTISPKGTSINKLDYSSPKSTIKITWHKQADQTTGYILQYSTNKNFKNAKAVKMDKNQTGVKMNNAKYGKIYYFRIRTYKTKNSGKEKYYSAWSSTHLNTAPTIGTSGTYVMSQCQYEKYPTAKIIGEKVKGYNIYTLNGAGTNNQTDYLCRTSGKKTVKLAKSNHSKGIMSRNIITNGNYAYYTVANDNGYGYIYRVGIDGKNGKMLLKQSGLKYVTGAYNNSIYYLRYGYNSKGALSNIRFCKYDLAKNKATTIYNKAWSFYENLDTNGRYMLFAAYSSHIDNVKLTLYDAKTGNYKTIANGWKAGFSGNSIYYITASVKYVSDYNYYTYNSLNIMRCDYNGKNKKYIKKNISDDYYPLFIGKTGAYFTKKSNQKYYRINF